MRLARLHRSLPLRSALALLLVAVQLLLGAHVFTHVQEARALAHTQPQAQTQAPAPGDGSREDGKSLAFHERCALCLAALDLEAALPAAAPFAVLLAWTLRAPVCPALALRPFEAPCPPGRGPPSVV